MVNTKKTFLVASDPIREGYGNYTRLWRTIYYTLVASDPIREGYGNV